MGIARVLVTAALVAAASTSLATAQTADRTLTPFEVFEVKRLRQKGRPVAPVVSILRREP